MNVQPINSSNNSPYFVPSPSVWPVALCASIIVFFIGAANWLHNHWFGPYLLYLGLFCILGVMCGWFASVIRENKADNYNQQVGYSFRWGMTWFIFSEVLFFAGFFAALFYTRTISVPELSGV